MKEGEPMVTEKYRVSTIVLVLLVVITNLITMKYGEVLSLEDSDKLSESSTDDIDPPSSNLSILEDEVDLVYGLRVAEVDEIEELEIEEVDYVPELRVVDTLPACELGATFYSYMDYGKLSKSSVQSSYVRSSEAYTSEDGLRYYGDYLLVALAQMYGPYGTKYRVTFSNGDQLLVMKGDEKSSAETNCSHGSGDSRALVEVIIDDDVMSDYWLGEGTLHNLLFEGYAKGTVYPVTFDRVE